MAAAAALEHQMESREKGVAVSERRLDTMRRTADDLSEAIDDLALTLEQQKSIWVSYVDEVSGWPYWYNVVTKESRWCEDAAPREDTDDLSAHVQRLRFRLVELQMYIGVVEDDCQFRCLAQQLFGSVDHHERVRADVARQISNDTGRYANLLAGGEEALRRFVVGITDAGEWGDHVSLQAAADAYRVYICLVTSAPDRGVVRVEPAVPPEGERTVWLAFWAGSHYGAVISPRV